MTGVQEHQKIIVIEWRKPKNAEERACYGMTMVNGTRNIANVFLNSRFRLKEGGWLLVEAFFHELGHVFLEFHTHKTTARKAESIARQIGEATLAVLKKGSGGSK